MFPFAPFGCENLALYTDFNKLKYNSLANFF